MPMKSVHPMNGLRIFPSPKKIAIYLLSAILVTAALVYLVTLIDPMPPRTITMACGPEGSSYAVFGTRYQKLLAKEGIQVKLVTTAGGVQNLELLNDPKSGVQVGFVEGGIPREADLSELASLGTISYEPMWFFARQPVTDQGLHVFRGKRISVGPEGSDSKALVDKLIKRNALDIGAFQSLSLSPEDAAQALLKGQIDAAFIMSTWNSPVVRDLIKADGIYLANFAVANFNLSGYVDSAVNCMMMAIVWTLLAECWWLLPLWGKSSHNGRRISVLSFSFHPHHIIHFRLVGAARP